MDPITTTITTTLPLTGYIKLFTEAAPITMTGPAITYSFDFMRMITAGIPVIPAIMKFVIVDTPVIKYYIGLRVGLTALLFVMAFVTKRLGMLLPTEPIAYGRGQRLSVRKLPKIPKAW